MALEKLFSKFKNTFKIPIVALSLLTFLFSCPVSCPMPTPKKHHSSKKYSKIPIISFSGWGTDNYVTQLAVMNEDGSDIQNIFSGPLEKNCPRFSPNRDKIIFELREEEVSTLYTINIDGSELTELVGSSERVQPVWSSKDKVAFLPQYSITTIRLFDISNPSVTEKLTSTYEVERTPSFSPDGDYIVCDYNDGNITQIDLATRSKTILVPGSWDDNIYNREPEFSPDGNKIAFKSNMYEEGNWDIYIYYVNSTNIERLTNLSSVEYSPHFSKDGSKIFFASQSSGTYQIYSMNSDGSNQKQLTYGPKDHDFGYHDL